MSARLALALLAAVTLGACGGPSDESTLSYKAGKAYADDKVQYMKALSSEVPSSSALNMSCTTEAYTTDSYGRTWETGDIEAGEVDLELFRKGCMAGMEEGLGYLRD